MTGTANVSRKLVGVWKVVAAHRRMEDTGEVVTPPNPSGYIIFEPGGRMMVILYPGERMPPTTDAEAAALFGSLTAYTGHYSIEGDRIETEIDAAWHPDWVGSRQVRYFAFDGNRLTLTSEVQEHPVEPGRKLRAVITWEREQ